LTSALAIPSGAVNETENATGNLKTNKTKKERPLGCERIPEISLSMNADVQRSSPNAFTLKRIM